jgi:hypothetical protein
MGGAYLVYGEAARHFFASAGSTSTCVHVFAQLVIKLLAGVFSFGRLYSVWPIGVMGMAGRRILMYINLLQNN